MPFKTKSSKRAHFEEHALSISPLLTITSVSSFMRIPTKPVQTMPSFEYPVTPVLEYIQRTWNNLLVSNQQLLSVIPEEKVEQAVDSVPILYISPKENKNSVIQELQKVLSAEDLNSLDIVALPESGDLDQLAPGLLYLPNPYIVPGGRFKEMYGWDSYFIQEGLLRDGLLNIAKGMTENQLYQIEKYGTVLNANRSYYINRSQPPFIARMVMDVYKHTTDIGWLKKALPSIENHYDYWVTGKHLISRGAAAGLSRYYAFGEGPAIEVEQGEVEDGKTHYQRIQDYYKTHQIKDYDVTHYYDAENDQLTPKFYRADRTMRESGFDPSNRFGPFNIDILHYAPVCLNSLLYKMETDMRDMYRIVQQSDMADLMNEKAEKRKQIMDQVLWNEDHGLYQDFNFKTEQSRYYPFATMFFPLWAGAASPGQAQHSLNNLPLLERAGGIMTSNHVSGNQWDAPFGWAPLQEIAAKGFLNYPSVTGAKEAAVRIASKFVNTIAKDFSKTQSLFEKYDVERMSSNVSDEIEFGYSSNEIGFGWTNSAFLELLNIIKQNSVMEPLNPKESILSKVVGIR